MRSAASSLVSVPSRTSECHVTNELANHYEVPMAQPEWFADVIERYQLSMPTP